VDPRDGLDDVEKRKFLTLQGLELRPVARSQSLYRLRYPGSYSENHMDVKQTERITTTGVLQRVKGRLTISVREI
jgi:hypothetical protein